MTWVVSIVSAVHRLTGASEDTILHSMPMMLCLQYFVQSAKENGVKGIGRRTSNEIARAKDDRSCQLIVDRLAELNVIKEEEKNIYKQQMMDVNNVD